MSAPIHQPMDKLFKQSMTEIIVAREFFQTHLPPALLEKIDLSTLKLEPNSFIDEVFKATEADLLYSVRMGEAITYLYLLCEQQSEVDKQIPYRLLVYTVRIIEMQKKQFPKSPLPVVYPLVVYTGKAPWNAPRDIFPLFGEGEALAREYLFKPYTLLDIHRISDEELRQQAWCGLIEFALKYRKARDIAWLWDALLPWLKEITMQHDRGRVLSKSVLRYVVDSMEDKDIELFKQKVKQHLTSDLQGEAMTLSEAFEQVGFDKGIQQGMQQGVQQGIAQGVQQGEKALLLHLLQSKFGEIPAHYLKLLQNADANMLLKLAEALVTAKSLEEIFE